MKRKRILFVDDEPNVLDGLRNLLRKQRNEWDMLFAPSGEAALAEMEREPVDVVVSDMRMPRMDGAELLRRVKDTYPQTARIVLSGHADRDAISRVISVAHQFLSKPSDATTVKAVIARTCEFQTLMQDDSVRRAVGAIARLPSLPDTYWDLSRAIENPQTGIAEVAKIVERDPAMSIKILQLVNSAYFGLPQKTESIATAAAYLGVDNLKGLVVAAHVFGTDNRPHGDNLSMDDFRREAVLTANLARQIVREAKNRDSAFTAGLVHDIGKLVLARVSNSDYNEILATARTTARPLRAIERETMGTTHGLVGAYLLGVWGLPFVVAETVAHHDEPGEVAEGNVDVLGAVHMASTLIEAHERRVDPLLMLDMPFLERQGLLAEIPRWRTEVEARLTGTQGDPR